MHCQAPGLPCGPMAEAMTARTGARVPLEAMTSQPAADPDAGELDSTLYLISDIEHIAKQVIRAASLAARQQMWKAYTDAIAAEEEAGDGPDVMPWDPPGTLSRLYAEAAKGVLFAVFTPVCDPAERARLAKVAAKEAEIIEKRMAAGSSGPEVSGKLRCMACGRPLPAGSKASRKTCSDNCRQKLRRIRHGQGQAAVRA